MLKRLKDTQRRLLSELQILDDTRKASARNYDKMKTELETVNKSILRIEPKPLTVSDHALVRYMERISGLSLDNLRTEILTEVNSFYISLGDGQYPVNTRFKAVVKSGNIVTIKGD